MMMDQLILRFIGITHLLKIWRFYYPFQTGLELVMRLHILLLRGFEWNYFRCIRCLVLSCMIVIMGGLEGLRIVRF